MKDVDKIILAIESMPEASYTSTGTIYTSDVIELIETMLAGKVIVPADDYDFLVVRTNCYCQTEVGEEYCNSDDCSICRIKKDYKAMLSTISAGDES